MRKKILLTITAVAAISLEHFSHEADSEELISKEGAVVASSGKCAAGKCGDAKRFPAVNIADNPQDKLVYARDGKCGLSGHSTRTAKQGKCSSGVCGNEAQ